MDAQTVETCPWAAKWLSYFKTPPATSGLASDRRHIPSTNHRNDGQLDSESFVCKTLAPSMSFAFSNDLRDDWCRRAVRIGLIEEQYGLSHGQVLAAARTETVGTCFNCSFRNVVTHVVYSPDFVRPHNPANSYDDFGPTMAALESRRRPRRQEQPHELLSPLASRTLEPSAAYAVARALSTRTGEHAASIFLGFIRRGCAVECAPSIAMAPRTSPSSSTCLLQYAAAGLIVTNVPQEATAQCHRQVGQCR